MRADDGSGLEMRNDPSLSIKPIVAAEHRLKTPSASSAVGL
jgi:hypothetical protein